MEYEQIKKRIDYIRKRDGIVPEPKEYNKDWLKPISDELKAKYQETEAVVSLLPINRKRSMYQHVLDKAFKMYVDSGYSMHPDVIANSFGISAQSFRAELGRANSLRPWHMMKIRQPMGATLKLADPRRKYLFQKV